MKNKRNKKESSFSMGEKLFICMPILIPILAALALKYETYSYNEAGIYKMAVVFWPIYVPAFMLGIALSMRKDGY